MFLIVLHRNDQQPAVSAGAVTGGERKKVSVPKQICSEDYSIEAVRAALDYGCTFLDTSEAYGPYLSETGHNEKIVGKAIRGRREDVVLATKLFIGTGEAKNIYDALRRHLEASLNRLGTDYVDLYYLHKINPAVPVERVAEGMGKLIADGLIRGWGLSMVTTDFIDRAHRVTPVSAVQNIYSMMERDYEKKVIPYCREHNIGFVSFSPIASGYLSGKVTAETKFQGDDVRKWVPQLSKKNIAANQPFIELVSDMAKRKGATNAQISLAVLPHRLRESRKNSWIIVNKVDRKKRNYRK